MGDFFVQKRALADKWGQKIAQIGDSNNKSGDHGGNRTHDCQNENLES